MNVALAAFVLTLLFLPAVSFRLAINRQENLKELLSTFSFTDSIWVFSLVPIFIHAVFLLCLFLTGFFVKFDLLLNILYSNKDFKIENHFFIIEILEFLFYCIFSIVVGYILGVFSNFLETRNNFLSSLLGLGDEWYNVFEGNISGAEKNKEKSEIIDLIYVDILSNTKETTILYSGILVNYYYKAKSTELDYLVLQAATRRDLRKEHFSDITNIISGKTNHYSSETSRPIKIPGEYFIVPIKEALNINVSYLNIQANEETIEAIDE